MKQDQRIVVMVSEDELRQIKEKAGLIPLSTWLRNLALNGFSPSRPLEIGDRVETARGVEVVVAKSSRRTPARKGKR